MTGYSLKSSLSLARSDDVSRFAAQAFSSLPRADQRRWAEVYLRGLLLGKGRKSVKRMAEEVLAMPAAQSLQQFINQSPWDWTAVRRWLAKEAAAQLSPRAWVIENTVIPKRGTHSVGVERRFVPSEGKAVNCQVGMGLFLASEYASVPVDWRIVLSPRWTEDATRRNRAYIPESVHSKDEWEYVLDMIDEVGLDWESAAAPVLADLRGMGDPGRLIAGLGERGVNFVVRVSATQEVIGGPHLAAVRPTDVPRQERRVTAQEYLRTMDSRHRQVIDWWGGEPGRPRRARLTSVPVRLPSLGAGRSPSVVERSALRLVGVRPTDGMSQGSVWLTNLTEQRTSEVMSLTRLQHRARADLHTLQDEFGLRDFEGRSYRGWHHHVTLVSAAFAHSRFAKGADLHVRQSS
ncbi:MULTISPECIES: IS701 family transposase [Actinoalloteichus]|uniref:Transposase family protein n=1 Tax=Actinoalloteichus fjordicus TaxID=1612552 RepID=A0AAC9LB17_9PSEU|nr:MULTISPECIES: IS701 family transposase [Actinoalloteichus]APU13590.1 transposase family protein [Actinoalloteichus fjordicus]APU19537.1 transposase family protein [Actinoalloteichus sp. GBA129-24]